MTRRLAQLKIIHAVARWLRRAGPIKSLIVAVALVNVVFFGCIQWTDGTRWGQRPIETKPPETMVDRQIRVRLLGRQPRTNVDLTVTSPFAITDTATGKAILPENAAIDNAAVRPTSTQGLQIGSKTIPSGDILIAPIRDASLVINGQTYRGQLRILRQNDGLMVVNHLDMEAYLRGVLRGEIPRSFHAESFKAQCVAARTYALYQKKNAPESKLFDVYDDEGSQMYVGVRGEDAVADRAVQSTAGEVCTWFNGQSSDIFCTYYSSACGGLSQPVRNVKPNDPDVPPLRGGVTCNDCTNAKFYRWDPVKLSRAEITKKLLARYPSLKKLGTVTDLVPKQTTTDGRIVRLEIIGSGGTKETLVGEDFRLAMGGRVLKSTNFKIEPTKDGFAFKNGRGFGHGMGLCQYGMDGKAKSGMDYKQILQTYYPGALVKKLY